MDDRFDDTLTYVLFLARHVRPGDLSGAVLIFLLEMRFQPHLEGFGYLRDSIEIKADNFRMQLSEIFKKVILINHSWIDSSNIEQSIRHCINNAWKNKNEEVWRRFLSAEGAELKKPSNGTLISNVACLAELWKKCASQQNQ